MPKTPNIAFFSQFKAAIFDLDGTLVHSQHVWDAAKLEVIGHYGYTASPALLRSHLGRGLNGFLDDVFDEPLSDKERVEIANKIGAVADNLLPKMRTPVQGAAELLSELKCIGLRIAICSSSPRRHIQSAIESLGLGRKIDAIVSGADLPVGKPDPLPYFATLDELGLLPQAACAFEDSKSGVESATAAGISVLAVGPDCLDPCFEHCAFQATDFSYFPRRLETT